MQSKLILSVIIVSSTLLPTSQSQADLACDAEVVKIQSILDAPPSGAREADLEQATILFENLTRECANGASVDDVVPLTQQIRGLLGMEDAS